MNYKQVNDRLTQVTKKTEKLRDRIKAERRGITKKEEEEMAKWLDEAIDLKAQIKLMEANEQLMPVIRGKGKLSPDFIRGFGENLRKLERGDISGFETRTITTTTAAATLDGRTTSDVVLQSLAQDPHLSEITVIPTTGTSSVTVPIIARGNYPTAAGRADETTAITTSTTTFTSKTLQKRNQYIYQVVANNLFRDAVEGTYQSIFEAQVKAMRDKLAYMILYGDSSVDGEFDGIFNYTGIQEVAAGGALTSYAKIIEAYKVLMQKNVEPEKIKAVMSPATWAMLADLQASDNQYIKMPSQVEDLPVIISSQVSDTKGTGSDESQIFIGDWSAVQLGLSENLTIRLEERHMDTDSTGLVSIMRSDMALFDPERFCMITGITVA